MTGARCLDCKSSSVGNPAVIVHTFSCPNRREGDPARCDYCRAVLPHDEVVRYGKKTCDQVCRAAAWKERVGYGRLDRPVASQARANGRPKPSGAQVSYRKAVEVLADELRKLNPKLAHPNAARQYAEMVLRDALPVRQRERLEARRG